MQVNKTIQVCIVINGVLLSCIAGIVFRFADERMLKVGYSKDLVILGVTIDTFDKYLFLQFMIFLVEFCYALIYEYANPIMYFSIFNADKVIINDFSKLELQIYAQSIWFLTSLKNGLMLLVAIQQIDITLSKIFFNEIAAAIVIRNLLNKKQFIHDTSI
jgi:hypothetical protein